jgi:hypothetical protein
MIVIGGTVQLVGTGKIPGDITLVGVASTGTTTSITLTGGVATTGYYNGQLVTIVGGTGAGQSRTILSYTSGTVATVTRDWVTGAASTITLDSAASGITGTYKNNFIMLTAGTGSGQTRLISAYDGGTKVATVIPAWTTQPVLGTVYQVLPAAQVDVGGWAGTLVPAPTTDGVPHTDLRYVDGDLITGDGAATPWGPA